MKSKSGDRKNIPATAASLRVMPPEAGAGKRPAFLRTHANARVLYTTARPSVTSSVRIAKEDRQDLWKITIDLNDGNGGVRPGRSLERWDGKELLQTGVVKRSLRSFRPPWADLAFYPRKQAVSDHPGLRRFNGRPVIPATVFDSRRVAFIPDAWPFTCVGRIFNNRGESGTASLIGDRLLLTAGHLVPWGDTNWWMKFVPAYYNGQSYLGAGVESYVSDARGYSVDTIVGYDWAILRLYEPLGTSLGYFGVNIYSTDWNDRFMWFNVGYPGDVDNAEQPALQILAIHDTDNDDNGGEELESNTCDIANGNSGGPMYGWFNNASDPRILGVVSGGEEAKFLWWETSNYNVFASGYGMLYWSNWGRTNWPA